MEQNSAPEKDRKLFLGGLSFDATEDDIVKTFSQYGEIVDKVIITKEWGPSRGFGFVTFATAEEADAVLNAGEIKMLGRTVDIKKALPREDEQPVKKIYVGNIGQLSKDDLQNYFERFGSIEEVIMPMSMEDETQNRGFVFIIFNDASVTGGILESETHDVNGTEVKVKKATQKPRRGGFGGGPGGGRTGGGGGFRSFGGRSEGGYGGGGGGGYRSGGYSSGYGGGGYNDRRGGRSGGPGGGYGGSGGSYGGGRSFGGGSYSNGGGNDYYDSGGYNSGSYNGDYMGYGDDYGSQGSNFGPVRGGRSNYGGGSGGGPYGGYGSGGGGYNRSGGRGGGGGRRY